MATGGKPLDSFGILFITRQNSGSFSGSTFRFEGSRRLRVSREGPGRPRHPHFRARRWRSQRLQRPSALQRVVLPAPRGTAGLILVYLLAAEQRVGEMVFGIHYRAGLEDGTKVKQLMPLSKSALVIPPSGEPSPGATPVAFVSQLVTDWPLETCLRRSVRRQPSS
jgi:hypothetical protein